MPVWPETLCDLLLPHRDPPAKTVPQHLVFQEPTLCFVSPWWSSMRFQHWVLLHLQQQSFLRIQHITKAQRSWMTQHSLWELGPLDILTSSCQRTWTKTKKNQSTLAIISLRISQVQWLVWRAVQTPLVSGSCLPRKESCAICSEFIRCKILFSSLLFSCPPGRQNHRGSINNSIPFIFLILSSFALFSFSSSPLSLLSLPLFFSSPFSLFSLSTSGVNMEDRLYQEVSGDHDRKWKLFACRKLSMYEPKILIFFFGPELQFSRVSKTFPWWFGSCLTLQYWRRKKNIQIGGEGVGTGIDM